MLELKVCEIRDSCPVYKVGDKIVIEDPRILLDGTDALCTCERLEKRQDIRVNLAKPEKV